MGELFNTIKQKVIDKLRQNNEIQVDNYAGVDDYETRDKALKNLRRHVRRIEDRYEKQKLQRIIQNDERKRERSWMINDNNILKYNTYKITNNNKTRRRKKR